MLNKNQNLLSLLSDPDNLILALLPSAYNDLVESAVREMPSVFGSLFGGQIQRETKVQTKSLALGIPESMIEVNSEMGAAVVTIKGMITPYADELWERAVDPRGIGATYRELADRGDIHTIFSFIESPGGHALGMTELDETMEYVRSKVKLIAYTDKLMASAAYWFGANHHEIYSAASAPVGSIGVYSASYSFDEMISKLGIKLNLVRDGKLKGMGIFGKELTSDELAYIEEGVQKISVQFKGKVKERRGAVADETMQGQCFDGDECQELLLTDGVYKSLLDLVVDKTR
ncbi:MAG: S49 family peptidase [Alphaproteobacteria bacterium]